MSGHLKAVHSTLFGLAPPSQLCAHGEDSLEHDLNGKEINCQLEQPADSNSATDPAPAPDYRRLHLSATLITFWCKIMC